MLLAGGIVVVASGFHDGYFEVWSRVARYFRDPDARLVLNRSDRFSNTRRHLPPQNRWEISSLDLRRKILRLRRKRSRIVLFGSRDF